jgi:aspartyl-tRNA(Asn)/glutamyl-tRNA(Gln) amidotransferase subunit C
VTVPAEDDLPLSPDQVDHVARLARLRLNPSECEQLRRELGAVLDYMNKLAELPTDELEPTHQVLDLDAALRIDLSRQSLPAGACLNNPPEEKNNFIVVPKIL